ncbi:MAG: hypothetical protein H0W73_14615 [Bacteroidetes bacterium]|nr:hypothetical protein [Bacteroidota bacterium]
MENISSFYIIKLLFANWKKLVIVAVISIGVSILITAPFIMPPDYKSSFIVYPNNMIPTGRESATEQLFQFFSSETVKNNLTKRFNLFEHYKIEKGTSKAQNTFNQIYNSNIQIKFTRYQSIDGGVVDESPEFAKELAEGLIDEINAAVRASKKEKYNEYVSLYSRQLKTKKTEIDSLENKLKFMRVNYGILDVTAQTKNVSKNSGKKELNAIDKELLLNLKEHSGEYTILQSRFNIELENYKFLKQNYDKNMIDLNANLSYVTVVSSPNLPVKKNSPNRLVILLMITLSSLFLSSIIIVFKDKKEN